MDVTFTIGVARRLDEAVDALVRKVLRMVGLGLEYYGPSPFFLQPDYDLSQLPLLAEMLGVDLDVLCQYRLLRDYLNLWAKGSSDPDMPMTPQELASHFCIPFGDFDDYSVKEVAQIQMDLAKDDDEDSVACGKPFFWETEGDELDDLMQLAGRKGMCW